MFNQQPVVCHDQDQCLPQIRESSSHQRGLLFRSDLRALVRKPVFARDPSILTISSANLPAPPSGLSRRPPELLRFVRWRTASPNAYLLAANNSTKLVVARELLK